MQTRFVRSCLPPNPSSAHPLQNNSHFLFWLRAFCGFFRVDMGCVKSQNPQAHLPCRSIFPLFPPPADLAQAPWTLLSIDICVLVLSTLKNWEHLRARLISNTFTTLRALNDVWDEWRSQIESKYSLRCSPKWWERGGEEKEGGEGKGGEGEADGQGRR